MALGLHESKWRRRRNLRWRVIKALLVLALLLAAGLFAYETGSMLAQMPVRNLEQQLARLNQDIEALRQANAQLSDSAKAARESETEWQKRYEMDAPVGESKELFNLLRDRMAAGIEARRLSFVIQATGNARTCNDGAATKRFMVKTPLYHGANDQVSFGKETITITAEGANAVNASGKAEGWFDPASPVTVRFTEIGGKSSEKTGTLPLHHAMVTGGQEYRFTVVNGPTGFLKVSGKRCKFP